MISTIDQVMPATVAVRMGGRRSGSSATGVLIGEDLVLTAGHVGEKPGRRASIELTDGRQFDGRTLGQVFESDVDIGLIRIETEGEELPKLEFGSVDEITPGDWVIMLGHASLTPDNNDEMAEPAARVGKVLRVVGPRLDVDAPFDSGDSGGPVVNLDGQLVGIVSRCGHHPWQNVATNIRAIKKIIPDLEESDAEVELPSGPSSRRPPRSSEHSKRDPLLLDDLAHLTWSVSPAIVEVFQDDRLVCFGTVIADGLVLSKASILARETDNPTVKSAGNDGSVLDAEIIALDPELDLALLEVEGLQAPQLDWVIMPPEAGRFLIVPTADGTARSLGTIARDEDHLEMSPEDKPFLGIRFDVTPDIPGIEVIEVVASSAAKRAGIEPDDVIRTFDKEPIDDRNSLRRSLQNYALGDEVVLGIIRGEKELDIPIRLGLRVGEDLGPIRSNTSTGTSRHSSGYGEVILSDAVIEPHEVGVPVVDLRGRAVGLIVARRGRTVTVVLPSERVLGAIKALKQRAQENSDDLMGRLGVYRAECTESQRGLFLDAADAIPRGDAIRRERFDDGRVTYGSWSDANDALEWNVWIDRPGKFEVILELACSSRSAGTPIRLSVGEVSLDSHVESTGGWGDFEEQNLGELEIYEPGEYTVRLEPLASPRRELMNFARLKLARSDSRE